MVDLQILKLLYLKKHDNEFHDVSLIFNVTNHNNYYNEIENDDTLNFHESQENSNVIRRLNNKLFRRSLNKEIIDKSVIALEENGYVIKNVHGRISFSAITSEDNPSDANNSICKITSKGIEYYEKNREHFNKVMASIISKILALIAIVISLLAFLK